MQTIIELSIFSPRWGHKDSYEFEFTDEHISLLRGAKEAIAKFDEAGSIVWSGHNVSTGNPLLNIMSDDHIYPPVYLIYAIENIWKYWLYNEISEDEFKAEFKKIEPWINDTTNAKPDSEFWNRLF